MSDQNLTSSTALFPLCAVFAVMSLIHSGAWSTWARIGIHSLGALACLVACYALWQLSRDRNAGHRWLSAVLLLFVACRAVDHAWIAFDWIGGGANHLPLIVMMLSNTAEIFFYLYVFTTRQDIQKTFHRSEAERRRNIHSLEQTQQASVNNAYIAKKNLQRSIHLPGLKVHAGRER